MQRGKVVLTLALCLAVGLWYWNKGGSSGGPYLSELLGSGEFLTLEASQSAEQIMEGQRDYLLRGPDYTYQKPGLKYYPYLLLDIKYSQRNGETTEGVILWSMVDGEMVLSTQTWETTHGFADSIRARATREDFLVMFAIQRRRGSANRETLAKDLGAEPKMLDRWIRSAEGKHLIVRHGKDYRLHFQRPLMDVLPQTVMAHRFVSKSYKHTERVDRRYSRRQIQDIAKASFGDSFAIREMREIFLPVYSIEVKNPDGSVMTSHWNALSGDVLTEEYLE